MECTLYLTDSCNLRCSYCYEADKKNKSFLNETVLRSALEFIINNNLPGDNIELIFLGGEPLLNKKMLYKAIDIINKEYVAFQSLFHYHITTNGILLDKKTVDFLVENNFDISISIDGNLETHNLNRTSVDGRDYYQQIISNMKYMVDNKINFFVRMTLTANNVHLLFDNVLFFYRMGVQNIHIGIDYLGKWDAETLTVFDSQMEKLDAYYLNELCHKEKGILTIYDYKFSIFIAKREPQYCSAGSKGHLVISSKGDFYPCGYVANDSKWLVGNTRNGLDEKGCFNSIRSSVLKKSSCENCKIAFTCNGAKCGFMNYVHTGFLNQNSSTTCELEKILYRHDRKVIKSLYRNQVKRFMNYCRMAYQNKIYISDEMQQIISEVNNEEVDKCTQ